uniref:Fibroblast growth factor 7 n=1 Tax=Sinocyclocheilus anshuiensis TaxID=1608454 RepID=A0A671NRX7_9TELE
MPRIIQQTQHNAIHLASVVPYDLFFFPGQKDYNDSCNFKEVFLENYYTAYSSVRWTKNGKEMFISLSQKGRPLRGKKTRKESISSHFIPRKCREDEKKLA